MDSKGSEYRFQYQKLPDQNSIRLLSLLPGAGDAKLVLSLEVADLVLEGNSSIKSYEALSYTWGDATEQHEASCSGLPFLLSTSLYTALTYLRYLDRPRTLWVDAICINQDDLEERDSQVSLMQSVYGQADQVIVWIGVHDDLTQNAIATIKRLYGFVKPSALKLQRLLRYFTPSLPPQPSTSPSLRLDRLETVALARFFQRPYFKRCWVCQEVVSAKRATVVCGTYTIEWEYLAIVCGSELLHTASRMSASMIRASPGILASRRIQKLRQLDSPLPLLSLLVSTRGLDATDPRDKLFAIQHLARKEDPRAIIDYRSSVVSTYTQFAVKILRSNSLDVLSAVNPSGIKASSSMKNLPSWVPDWSVKPDFSNYPGEHLPLTVTANHFQASGSSAPTFQVSESTDILTVRGGKIDSISELSPSGWGSTVWDDGFGVLDYEFDEPSSDISPPSKLSEAGDESLRLLLEILVCDTDKNGDRLFPRRLTAPKSFMEGLLPNGASLPYLPGFMRQPIFSSPLLQRIHDMSWGRRLCFTASDYIGLVPQDAQVGDAVCYFLGGRVLYLLRPESGSEHYTFVGECYLHGLMHGEVLENKGIALEDFSLH